MPTGYTHDIPSGIDFKTFAMNCARAFGACVELRHEPAGGDRIPAEFAPSTYHAEAADNARAALAALDAMTAEDCERAAAKAWDDAETFRLARLEKSRKTRAAYEAMLRQVRAWTPPTDEHKGLHQFMAEQIIESIRFDCNESYYQEPTARASGAEWLARQREQKQKDAAYHDKEHAAEIKRAADRTAWVSALRASLNKGA